MTEKYLCTRLYQGAGMGLGALFLLPLSAQAAEEGFATSLLGHSGPDYVLLVLILPSILVFMGVLLYVEHNRRLLLERLKLKDQELEAGSSFIKTAMDHSRLYFWQYNLQADTAKIGERLQQDYQMPPVIEDFSHKILLKSGILPEYWARLEQLHDRLRQGERKVSLDVQLQLAGKELPTWAKISYTLVPNPQGDSLLALGSIQDCDVYRSMEVQFLTSLQQMDISTWVYYIQSHVLVADQNCVDVFGLNAAKAEDVPECFIRENRVHPEDVETLRSMHAQLERGVPSVSGLLRIRKKGMREYFWFQTSYTTVFDQQQRPVKAIGSSVDVTEHVLTKKRYERELVHRQLLEGSALAYAYLNLTQKKLLKLSVQSQLSILEKAIKHSDSLDVFRAAFVERLPEPLVREQAALLLSPKRLQALYEQGKHGLSQEYQLELAPQQFTWVKLNMELLDDPDSGDLVCFFYLQDINRKKLLELVLQQVVRQEMDAIVYVDVATEQVHLVTRGNRVLNFSLFRNLEGGTGCCGSYEQFLEAFLQEIVLDKERLVCRQALQLERVRKQLEASGSLSYYFHAVSGTRQLLRVYYLEHDTNIMAFLFQDVTAIYEQEQERKQKLEQALVEAEQANNAKGEFLSRMSHEIRTPLNAILGIAALGLEDAQEQLLVNYFYKIKESGDYLLGLINDILDMAKLMHKEVVLHPAVVNIEDFLESVRTIIQPLAEAKRISCTIQAKALPYASAGFDRLRLQQIFVNLLSNAVKFTPAEGKVTCLLQDCGGTLAMRRWQLIVKDSGIGMSKAFADKIFQPFEQDHNHYTLERSGMGLGLAISKNLAELMGGKIQVVSQEGLGTTVTAEVCVYAVISEAAHAATAPAPKKADIKGSRVLMVEDHPLNMEITKRILERAGAQVETAANGQIAVTMFRNSNLGYYDLVLMDVRMPVMNGLDATRIIRGMDRDDATSVPIVAMTANAFPADIDETRAAGMNAHLCKPVDPKMLVETVADLL